MNLKKRPKTGQCHALRCTEEAAINIAGMPWGVETAQLCLDHYNRAVEDYPTMTQPSAIVKAPPADGVAVAPSEEPLEEDLLARRKDAADVSKMARSWPMDTPEALEDLAQVLTLVKGQRDELEGEIQSATSVLAKELEKRRATYRPLKKALADAESTIKARFSQHRIEEEERNRKLKEAAAEAYEQGRVEEVEGHLSQVTNINDTQGVTTRLKWDFVIEDESKLPREFLMPNEKLIKEHCNHSTEKAPTAVPGVRFVPSAVVSGKRAAR